MDRRSFIHLATGAAIVGALPPGLAALGDEPPPQASGSDGLTGEQVQEILKGLKQYYYTDMSSAKEERRLEPLVNDARHALSAALNDGLPSGHIDVPHFKIFSFNSVETFAGEILSPVNFLWRMANALTLNRTPLSLRTAAHKIGYSRNLNGLLDRVEMAAMIVHEITHVVVGKDPGAMMKLALMLGKPQQDMVAKLLSSGNVADNLQGRQWQEEFVCDQASRLVTCNGAIYTGLAKMAAHDAAKLKELLGKVFPVYDRLPRPVQEVLICAALAPETCNLQPDHPPLELRRSGASVQASRFCLH